MMSRIPLATVNQTQTSQPRSSSRHNVPVGAIVGGVVGGAAFLSLLAAVLFVFRRRQKHRHSIDTKRSTVPSNGTMVQLPEHLTPFGRQDWAEFRPGRVTAVPRAGPDSNHPAQPRGGQEWADHVMDIAPSLARSNTEADSSTDVNTPTSLEPLLQPPSAKVLARLREMNSSAGEVASRTVHAMPAPSQVASDPVTPDVIHAPEAIPVAAPVGAHDVDAGVAQIDAEQLRTEIMENVRREMQQTLAERFEAPPMYVDTRNAASPPAL
ncbi:hypothetical protein BV25DRAFT_1499291 [Artomyces pyxidatus]|uniref:Uncharacterized protein n=1 Tax=Artomyces pyxidatus TaxID=48021 RepID=A0ACB8TCD0_9AGAM|nr:hypothetical protein BV25DRAFT_1499291 [Artomyces pyxidatus]